MQLSVAILFLVTTIVNLGCYADDDDPQCPVGVAGARTGSSSAYNFYCPNGNVLFAGLKNVDEGFCCQAYALRPCTSTGMLSQVATNAEGDKSLFYAITKQHTKDELAGYVYDVKQGKKHYVCPYPIGYLWYGIPLTRADTPKDEYMPTDYVNTETKLKPCTANKDCEADEFCGDVINPSHNGRFKGFCSNKPCTLSSECSGSRCGREDSNQPYVDRDVHFCYKSPKIGQDQAKYQMAVSSSERNLKFCNSDSDCKTGGDTSAICHTTLAPKVSSQHIKWSKFVPETDPEEPGKRESFQGLCIEAIPYSYTLAKIFEELSDLDQMGEAGRKLLPFDYDAVKKRRDQLKKCTKNVECPKEQFCDNMYNLAEVANYDNKVRFCFAAEVHNDPTKRYAFKAAEQGITICTKTEDCVASGLKNSFCHISPNIQYNKKGEQTIELVDGICVEAKEDEGDSSSMMIIIVVVVLIVIILAALIGGFVLFKLKAKKNQKGKKGKNDKSELTKKKSKKEKKGKKEKKEKKHKKGNKTSKSTASTTKSTSMTGQSGMGTTTGGYSPAIY